MRAVDDIACRSGRMPSVSSSYRAMCGIGGVLRIDGKRVLKRWLDGIDRRIAHRGADDAGQFRDRFKVDISGTQRSAEVGLVHRRLSILDPGCGAQPMVSKRGPDGSGLVAVTFDGTLYNHRELRATLESNGHRFTSDHSDTEVLLHGHRQWGPVGLAQRLEGMYAYAIWDHAAGTITMARDPLGARPLYYAASGADYLRVLAFASDPVAVGQIAMDLPQPETSQNPALATYLQLGYPAGGPLGHVDTLPVLELEPGGVHSFQATERKASRVGLDGQAGGHQPIEPLLQQAVERRLEADVPLACLLGGDIASSLVAWFASRKTPGLRTFGMRMPEPFQDTSCLAERAAVHMGTEHTTLDIDIDPADDLVALIEHLGQPFGDSAILSAYWVYRAVGDQVTVALSGDGGRELFLEHRRYRAARRLAAQWRFLRLLPVHQMRRGRPGKRLDRLESLTQAARDYPRTALAALVSRFTPKQLDTLLGRPADDLHVIAPGADAIAALRLHDMHHAIPFDLMRAMDTASMMAGLEVRCPFLDRDLVQAMLAIPTDEVIPGRRRKGMLSEIARRHLPSDVIEQAPPVLAVPIGRWFRTDYGKMRTLLLDQLRSTDPFGSLPLTRSVVKKLINEHLAYEHDHGQKLFALLTLSLWVKNTAS
jgi:asparagine synthase (glutamine-hydrolysing)